MYKRSNVIKCSPPWDKQFQCAPTVKGTSLGGDHGSVRESVGTSMGRSLFAQDGI
jgi:hypothetical protein